MFSFRYLLKRIILAHYNTSGGIKSTFIRISNSWIMQRTQKPLGPGKLRKPEEPVFASSPVDISSSLFLPDQGIHPVFPPQTL
jgi:hypothetical protein